MTGLPNCGRPQRLNRVVAELSETWPVCPFGFLGREPLIRDLYRIVPSQNAKRGENERSSYWPGLCCLFRGGLYA